MIIESYLRSLLRPQLQVMGLNKRQQDLVCDDIHARLSSLLGNWDDTVFRKTTLLLGTEDATFYQPANVDLEIRALVVVGIRNSMLEDLSADRPFMKEFVSVAHCLPDSLVPVITSQAVDFFASTYREMGGWKTSAPTSKADVFRSLSRQFPESWRRFELLANSDFPEHDLHHESAKPFNPPSLDEEQSNRQDAKTTVLSGYAPNIDPDLRNYLQHIRDDKVELFFTSTFKWLTRNPAKLLKVIELLLSWNSAYVTSNYIIRRDYCAKRKSLMRPPHTVGEMKANLANQTGMTDRHCQCLKLISQQYG